jgi:Zn finger protein HypA/HybF involved in hydrogenase expression
MHELSVIMSVVDTVDEYLKAGYPSGSPCVTRVTLQVGRLSSYIPAYISEIWPFAANETCLGAARLEIEELPGREFLIKEIEVEE